MRNQRRAGTLLSYLYIVVNTFAVLVFQKVAIASLGGSEYGLYQLAASVINYLTVMDLGFNNGIVNYTAKYRATGRDHDVQKLHGMFKMIFYGIGLVAVGIGAVITLNVDTIYSVSMTAAEIEKSRVIMSVLTVNLGLTFALSIYNAIIIACEEFIFAKALTIIRSLLNPVLMIPILLLGADSVVMVIVLSSINVFCLLLNYLYTKYKLRINVKFLGFDGGIFRDIFSYSIFIFLAEVVDKINWSVDQIILGVVKGTKEVTVYSVASTYNQLVNQISGCVSSVMLPKIAAMVATGEKDTKLNELFVKSSRIQLYTVLMIIGGFALFGYNFIIWHAGKGSSMSYFVGLILMTAGLVPITQSVAIVIIKAKDRFKFRAILMFVMAFVNVAISIPLAIFYGSVGSALGTAITLVAANIIIINIYYQKSCGINVIAYWKNFIPMVLKLAPAGLIVLAVKLIMPLPGLYELFIYGALYVVLFCAFSYFVCMNGYEKGIVKKYARKVFSFI